MTDPVIDHSLSRPTPKPDDHPIERVLDRGEAAVARVRKFFSGYFWLIAKNVVGWLLILLAFPIGITLPGPGGMPMFLIGFALVAFPGKRKITSHVLRGRPLRIEASIFTSLTTIASLIVIGVLLWFVGEQYQQLIRYFNLNPAKSTPAFIAAVAGLCVLAAIVTYVVMRLTLLTVNRLIRLVPRARRFMRPYLRKMGIVLLPPPKPGEADLGRHALEIMELSATSRARYGRWWKFSRPWLRRFLGLGLMSLLLFYVIEPIVRWWSLAERHVNQIGPTEFVMAVLLGSLFLVAFRVVPWWMLLSAFGHRLHGAATTRIWISSELGRYLPGIVRQLKLRAALVRPYGISQAACSTTHVLETILFVIANVVFAFGCLLLLGTARTESETARWWMLVALCLLPLLLPLLHPRVFYSLINRILLATARPRLQTDVRGWRLAATLLWMIGGLAFMSLTIWLFTAAPLGLGLRQWWLVGGIYCVAWLAGCVAFWAPGGLGVREAVFVALLLQALPTHSRQQFTPEALAAFAGVLALVLRVWSMAGEIIVTLGAYALDLEGARESVRGQEVRATPLRRR